MKSFLLCSPLYYKYFEAIKPYISIQATVASVSDIRVFLTKGQKGKFIVTYCIHCCQIYVANKHLTVAEIQFCVCSNQIARCEKCDRLCIAVPHKGEI
jgi:hypothetical protein